MALVAERGERGDLVGDVGARRPRGAAGAALAAWAELMPPEMRLARLISFDSICW